MQEKIWNIKEVDDLSEVIYLADSLNISESIAKLLVMRSIKTFTQAKSFFRPSLDSLYDPFLMNGMAAATQRVIDALTSKQQIVIYGDYDVDGTCSTALLVMFLRELGASVEYYIPNRVKEGYGITPHGIDFAKSLNTSLMISVDCGITANEEVLYANSLGIDVIICDHHQPKDHLPEAFAILDPLKPCCNYPFKYLSGAGVAFKLAQGISDKIGKKDLPFKYLDLVALAGAADIVPLIDENRILVREGIEQINKSPRAGIASLIRWSGMEPGNLSSSHIVFTLAPRINAVGRLGDANIAVNLLMTTSKQEAEELAGILDRENKERRKIDEDTLISAMSIVENKINLNDSLGIVLHEEGWHPGVIGIVASRLVEKFHRPTIMLTTIDGVAKGSARSIPQFNMYDALKECEDLLIHYGGHQAAAGLALEIDKLDEFRQRFNSIVREKLNNVEPKAHVDIDSKIRLAEMTPKFRRIIDQFAPFGPGNLRPTFLAENVELAGIPRFLSGKHIAFVIKQNGCEKVFDCIAFNFSEYWEKMNTHKGTMNIVFGMDNMQRDGKLFPQFRIKDINFN